MAPLGADSYMSIALEEARLAAERGEVPVGAALIAPDGSLLSRNGNRTLEYRDPTAHAEILVIRAACTAQNTERLINHDLYVTLEPCPMCATAISFARLGRLYYGASDSKGGGIEGGPRIFSQATCHHRPDLYPGIAARQASELLKEFFSTRRNR